MSRNFTAIWFAISAMISCILLPTVEKTQQYLLQLAIFLGLGIFLLVVIRPHWMKWLEKRKENNPKKQKDSPKKESSEKPQPKNTKKSSQKNKKKKK